MDAMWVCVRILAAFVVAAAIIWGPGVLTNTAQLPVGMHESE